MDHYFIDFNKSFNCHFSGRLNKIFKINGLHTGLEGKQISSYILINIYNIIMINYLITQYLFSMNNRKSILMSFKSCLI